MQVELPACGHAATVSCGKKASILDDPTTCNAPCAQLLKCGHPCTQLCGSCMGASIDSGTITKPWLRSELAAGLPFEALTRLKAAADELGTLGSRAKARQVWKAFFDEEAAHGRVQGNKWMAWVRGEGRGMMEHGRCHKRCEKPLPCGHYCGQGCHLGKGCGGCKEKCWIRCRHHSCKEACDQPCVPCAGDCGWRCKHQGGCSMPCSAPCDRCAGGADRMFPRRWFTVQACTPSRQADVIEMCRVIYGQLDCILIVCLANVHVTNEVN
jgi:hypothetical protein